MPGEQLRIALVAHDRLKEPLVAWCARHEARLSRHRLWATGTTGAKVCERTALQVTLLKSGPLGGDQQIGAMIVEGRLDVLVFFWDPLTAMPHDVDVKALLRVSVMADILVACNGVTADLIASVL